MKRILTLVVFIVLVGLNSPPAYAATTCRGANLECEYNSDCVGGNTCTCGTNALHYCTKTLPTATPRPPTITSAQISTAPTIAPITCGTAICNICATNNPCSVCTDTCNNSTNKCGYICSGGSACTAWNPIPPAWGACIGCYRYRSCSAPSGNLEQQRTCDTGCATNCPNFCNGANPTSTPGPSPTPWIKVNVKNEDGSWHTSSQICGVDCSGTVCTKKTGICSVNDARYTFTKFNSARGRLGGRIALTDQSGKNLVVVGITPSVSGFSENTCNGIGGACYVWPKTSWTTGGRTVNFVVAIPTPTAFIRVGAYNQDLTLQVVPKLCKANCVSVTSPCSLPACAANVSTATFAGQEANMGGSFNSPLYKVLGVTPYVNGVVTTAGTMNAPSCSGRTDGSYCLYWPVSLDTGSRELRFVVVTNTPTPTRTPGPGPWIKLKNTSYISKNDLTDNIPASPVAYDTDDTAQPYFIIDAPFGGNTIDNTKSGGLVAAPNISINGLKANEKDWQATGYTTSYTMTPSRFLSYVQARKTYTKINSLDEITADGIYVYNGGTSLQIDSDSVATTHKIVLISSSATVAIMNNALTKTFNPSGSVAIIAPTINFQFDMTQASGIFIADHIDTNNSDNIGLKIIGNLITQSDLINDRKWFDPNIPSLFIVFDSQKYIDLLPYLSTANYKWRQSQ